MAVAALADELGSAGRSDAAGIVGAIDLLLSELFSVLPSLPTSVVHGACATLADMLIEAARRAGTTPAPSVCVDGRSLQDVLETMARRTAPSAGAAALTC